MQAKVTQRKLSIVSRVMSVIPFWGQPVSPTWNQEDGTVVKNGTYLRGRKIS